MKLSPFLTLMAACHGEPEEDLGEEAILAGTPSTFQVEKQSAAIASMTTRQQEAEEIYKRHAEEVLSTALKYAQQIKKECGGEVSVPCDRYYELPSHNTLSARRDAIKGKNDKDNPTEDTLTVAYLVAMPIESRDCEVKFSAVFTDNPLARVTGLHLWDRMEVGCLNEVLYTWERRNAAFPAEEMPAALTNSEKETALAWFAE